MSPGTRAWQYSLPTTFSSALRNQMPKNILGHYGESVGTTWTVVKIVFLNLWITLRFSRGKSGIGDCSTGFIFSNYVYILGITLWHYLKQSCTVVLWPLIFQGIINRNWVMEMWYLGLCFDVATETEQLEKYVISLRLFSNAMWLSLKTLCSS